MRAFECFMKAVGYYMSAVEYYIKVVEYYAHIYFILKTPVSNFKCCILQWDFFKS